MSLKNYKLFKVIGSGTFGRVKLGIHLATKENVAIKTIDKAKLISQDLKPKIEREVWVLQFLKHPNLVRIYEAIVEERQIHIVMEYVPNGELFDQIANRGKIPEHEARAYFQQLISCLEYCHNRKITHRDLKPENILLGEGTEIKLVDFGLSNHLRDGRFLLTSCGSPNYAAPEVVSGKMYCGSEVDIWSCGVILFALLTGSLPFDDSNLPALFQKIKTARYFLPPHLSDMAKNLIKKMLNPDPINRITIPEIKRHPWYKANLPLYLALMDNTKPEESQVVDPEILNFLITNCNYGITSENLQEVKLEIASRKTTPYTVAYELLLSQKERESRSKFRSKKIKNVFSPDSIFAPKKDQIFAPIERECTIMSASTAEADSIKGSGSKWVFGIQSKQKAYCLLQLILKALRDLGFRWKFELPKYKIKCAKVLEPGCVLKYEVILYKNNDSALEITIDVRKVDHESIMYYFDFLSSFHDILHLYVCYKIVNNKQKQFIIQQCFFIYSHTLYQIEENLIKNRVVIFIMYKQR